MKSLFDDSPDVADVFRCGACGVGLSTNLGIPKRKCECGEIAWRQANSDVTSEEALRIYRETGVWCVNEPVHTDLDRRLREISRSPDADEQEKVLLERLKSGVAII